MVYRCAACLLVICFAACSGNGAADDTAQLLRLHAEVLAAHIDGDVERWLELESEDFVVVSEGEISFPTVEQRRAAREPYLTRARFTAYEDVRPPIVRVAADGSIGWLIAQVRVRGEITLQDGTRQPLDSDWSWIELYRKVGGEWKLTGNVSNRRP